MHNVHPNVASQQENLLAAVGQLDAALDGSEAKEDLLADFLQRLDELVAATEAVGLHGLQDACLLFQERIAGLTEVSTEAERDLLAAWPRLVRAYLQSPDAGSSGEALVGHLRDGGWPEPLAEADAQMLRSLLVVEASDVSDDDPLSGSGLTIVESDEADDQVAALLGSDESDSSGPLEDDPSTANQRDVSDGTKAVLAVVDHLEDWLETSPSEAGLLSTYSARLDDLVAAADAAGLHGLQDACLLFQERVAGFTEVSTDAERQLMVRWPPLVRAYLRSPVETAAGDGLVGHLRDERWPEPLAEVDAEMLRSLLAVEAPEAADNDPLSGSGLTVVEADEPEGPAAATGRGGQLESTVPLEDGSPPVEQGEDSSGPEGVVAAVGELDAVLDAGQDAAYLLQAYTDQLECLVTAAEAAELHGLQDACLLLQERLMALGEVSTDAERELLAAWPRLVRAHLQSPESASAGEALVSHLRDERWPDPLADVDAKMLRSLLEAERPEAGGGDPLSGSGLTVIEGDEPAEEAPMAGERGRLEVTVPLDEPSSVSVAADSSVTPLPVAEQKPETPADSDGAAELGDTQRELRDLLLAELTPLDNTLRNALTEITSTESDQNARRSALLELEDHVDRFGAAAEAAGFEGLQQACSHTHETVEELWKRDGVSEPPQTELLEEWAAQVGDYLRALGDKAGAKRLLSYLQDARWPRKLTAEESKRLVEMLERPALVDDEEVVSEVSVTAEDASLDISQRVDPQVLESLLHELPGQTEALSGAIQRLAQGDGTLDDVQAAQRVAHTVKGAANTVGVRGVATLTHRLEDILLSLFKHATLPSQALAETLVRACDCLETMSEALMGTGEPPQDSLAVLQEIVDWLNRIAREGISVVQGAGPATAADTSSRESAGVETEKPGAPSVSAPEPMLRVPAALVDNMLRMSGETIILTGQVHERVRQALGQTRSMRGRLFVAQQLGQELEQFIELRDVASLKRRAPLRDVFDPLEFDQYNELHTYSRRLMEAATDAREAGLMLEEHLTALDAMLVNQEHLNRDTQSAVLDTRMVPARTIVSRLQRSVRQTCRLTGKQAELEVLGADTRVDSDVLNQLVDPLMHMLRNAVDHGIEAPERRQESGKRAMGRITLEFVRDGNHVVVFCQDDGQGLDLERIQSVAEARGIVTEGQIISDDAELQRLILRPNFSTRDQVTQTSGRGIGLDAVYSRVLELSGSMEMSSVPGEGFRIELRLPVTLISTHALLVPVGQYVVGISARGVQHILHVDDGEIRDLGSDRVFHVGDEVYPVYVLEALLGAYANRSDDSHDSTAALIIRSDVGQSAVLVEKVLDTRDLVVKNMGQYVPKLGGIIGATILGDGGVTPVLDLPELLRSDVARDQEWSSLDAEPGDAPETRSVLVVDDSLSARRSLAQFAEDIGYRVFTARDGMEAVPIIRDKHPDVLLVDLEMPRMNGLELTRHVRTMEGSTTLPIIMITSRSTEKHRQEAKAAGVNIYLTKPFSEDELLKHMESLGGKE